MIKNQIVSHQSRGNAIRGEIIAKMNGKNQPLLLSLGALAQLETALGCNSLAQLATDLSSGAISAKQIRAVISAGSYGAGHPLSEQELDSLTTANGVAGLIAITRDLLVATFAPNPQEAETGNHNESDHDPKA
ncbi:gene transfer agent family protein [Polycladidibacter stylochi]|uniref:gene transfer agent family protein n=1 Tax=Polycladidibacter stylochi TaxID=1807766 RepID=UPI0008338D12|nr:gene transfer agent family protein [Pseudovibrio stylochi]